MIDLLYDSSGLPPAVTDMLAEELPSSAQAHAEVLPDSPPPTVPYVLVTGRSPALSGPMMAGDQQAVHTLTVLSVGENATQAKMLGDLARWLILGRDRQGAFLNPIPLEGREVIGRGGGTDGAPDNPGGVPQWTETFTLTVARSS